LYLKRSTIDYHDNETSKSRKNILKRNLKKNSEIEKKFIQIKAEITSNLDDLDETSKLLDEMIRATRNYNIIKKLFWSNPDFYHVIVNQLIRYLPKSPANMFSNRAPYRRIKELECSIALIECLSVMFNETEFYKNRNDVLSHERCQLLVTLVNILLCDPELPEVSVINLDEEQFQIRKKFLELVSDLALVSSILLWETLIFLNLSSWSNDYFNFDNCIEEIEKSPNLETFINRLMSELTKIIMFNENVLLSAGQTIIIFKMFSLFKMIMEKSPRKQLNNLFRKNFQEEFKYYFSQDVIKSKCYNYYPIMNDLISIVKKLENFILE